MGKWAAKTMTTMEENEEEEDMLAVELLMSELTNGNDDGSTENVT